MRIAINTRFLLKNKLEGIGWFTFEVIRRFVKLNPQHQFYFFFDRPYDERFLFEDNITPVVLNPPARHPLLWYWWFEYSVPSALKKYNIDAFISTDGYLSLNTDLPQLLVIHDLAFEHYPKDVDWAASIYYRKYSKKYAQKASRIITVSEYTKHDVNSQYGIDLKKIDVVYNGANSMYKPISAPNKEKVRAHFSNGYPYFLYVGAIHPRKNVITLLKAFEQFKETREHPHKLMIVGRWAWKNKELNGYLNTMKHKEDVLFMGSRQADELKDIIASAEAMMYLSYFEGFGIPVLESIYCEVPVIISDRTSLPEVAGEGGPQLDPFDVEGIEAAMNSIVVDESLRTQYVEAGRAQKQKFSWNLSAERFNQSFIKFAAENNLNNKLT
tara:strand:+ start:1454 stop:2605 length:1152 start_codon:yes stop_codon:yes gene_type:complete